MDNNIYIKVNTLEEIKIVENHFNKLGICNSFCNIYEHYKKYEFETKNIILKVDYTDKALYVGLPLNDVKIIEFKQFIRKVDYTDKALYVGLPLNDVKIIEFKQFIRKEKFKRING